MSTCLTRVVAHIRVNAQGGGGGGAVYIHVTIHLVWYACMYVHVFFFLYKTYWYSVDTREKNSSFGPK